MKVLNLYAGIGGNRKLWTDCDVTAIEIDPEIAKIYQDFFPNDTVIVGDAHQYLLDHYKEFDFIWSSPPCPSHSRIRIYSAVARGQNDAIYPEMSLYQEVIFLDNYFDGKWIIENVVPFYDPLIKPSFELHRHIYWSNFKCPHFIITNHRKHDGIKSNSIIYGYNLDKYIINDKTKILRNMVDPELGLHIFNYALERMDMRTIKQTDLFTQ